MSLKAEESSDDKSFYAHPHPTLSPGERKVGDGLPRLGAMVGRRRVFFLMRVRLPQNGLNQKTRTVDSLAPLNGERVRVRGRFRSSRKLQIRIRAFNKLDVVQVGRNKSLGFGICQVLHTAGSPLDGMPNFQQTPRAVCLPLMIPEAQRFDALLRQNFFAGFVTLDAFG
jgi:hypothetical protein